MEHAAHHPAGWRMPAQRIRDERLAIALDLLQRTVKDAASFPVSEQEALRLAVVSIQRVQTWCARHGDNLLA
jgi:hypothetical protein